MGRGMATASDAATKPRAEGRLRDGGKEAQSSGGAVTFPAQGHLSPARSTHAGRHHGRVLPPHLFVVQK